MHARPSFLSRACLVAATVASAGSLTGCIGLTELDQQIEKGQEKEDDKARLAHFEDAAQTYYDGGKYAQAIVQWRRVLELDPNRPKANWGLAKSLAMTGSPANLREAEQIFLKIKDWDWSHPTLGDRRHEVLKDFAEVYVQLADYYDRDVRALQEKLEQPNADGAKIRQQLQEQAQRRNELLAKAIPLYQEVLARSPDNPYAIGGLAKANLMAGNDQAGIAYARQYIDISVRSQQSWQQQLETMQKERGADLTEEQRAYFKDRIRGAREKELKLRLLLASVLMRNNDSVGAVREYDRVIELDPAVPASYVERAQAYARGRSYRLAVNDLEHYLKITDPVAQRQPRIRAAELLEKYRVLASAEGDSVPTTSAPGGRPGGYPPPPPPPAPAPLPRSR
ncbi:MAG: tetratricopeptide repeat protein [Planctomycetia bacterium]|nr:tetratricopeptide repeat protein [Planctomycetia bacterium]